MALVTIRNGVPHGQWEETVIHRVRVPTGADRIMTLEAVRGETTDIMVRGSCVHEIGPVTTDTIVPNPVELGRIPIAMTLHATQIRMRTEEREAILFVQLRDVIDQPALWGMTSGAIITQGHAMHIRMTTDTLHWSLIEHHGRVARLAIHHFVHTIQEELSGIVIEHHRLRIRSDLPFHLSRTSLMLYRTRNLFAPDQGGIGPSGWAVTLTAIDL